MDDCCEPISQQSRKCTERHHQAFPPESAGQHYQVPIDEMTQYSQQGAMKGKDPYVKYAVPPAPAPVKEEAPAPPPPPKQTVILNDWNWPTLEEIYNTPNHPFKIGSDPAKRTRHLKALAAVDTIRAVKGVPALKTVVENEIKNSAPWHFPDEGDQIWSRYFKVMIWHMFGCVRTGIFWFMASVWVAFTLIAYNTYTGEQRAAASADISASQPNVMKDFLPSLLIAFYTGAIYDRFAQIHDTVCGMCGAVGDVIAFKNKIFSEHRLTQYHIWRWTNAAQMVMYCSQGERHYSYGNFFTPMCKAYGDREMGLLSRNEYNHLKSLGASGDFGAAFGYCIEQAFYWAHASWCAGFGYDGNYQSAMEGALTNLAGKRGFIAVMRGRGMPFTYTSRAKYCAIYLLCFEAVTTAYKTASLAAGDNNGTHLETWFKASSIAGFIIMLIVLCGLLRCTFSLSDPFGPHIMDLNCYGLARGTLHATTLAMIHSSAEFDNFKDEGLRKHIVPK